MKDNDCVCQRKGWSEYIAYYLDRIEQHLLDRTRLDNYQGKLGTGREDLDRTEIFGGATTGTEEGREH